MSKSNKIPANPQYRKEVKEKALAQRKVSRGPVDPYCDDGLDAWEARDIPFCDFCGASSICEDCARSPQ